MRSRKVQRGRRLRKSLRNKKRNGGGTDALEWWNEPCSKYTKNIVESLQRYYSRRDLLVSNSRLAEVARSVARESLPDVRREQLDAAVDEIEQHEDYIKDLPDGLEKLHQVKKHYREKVCAYDATHVGTRDYKDTFFNWEVFPCPGDGEGAQDEDGSHDEDGPHDEGEPQAMDVDGSHDDMEVEGREAEQDGGRRGRQSRRRQSRRRHSGRRQIKKRHSKRSQKSMKVKRRIKKRSGRKTKRMRK